MVTPIAGRPLDEMNGIVTDPLVQIVARLAKSIAVDPDSSIELGNIVEADFPGYAAIPLAPSLEKAIDDETYGEFSPQRLTFAVSADCPPQPIVAVYYTSRYNNGPVDLVTIVPFDDPISAYYRNQVIAFEATVAGVKQP